MKFALFLLMMVIMIFSLADALTESSAYITSNLVSYDSNFSALRTIFDSATITSDLDFSSNGIISAEYKMSDRGVHTLIQRISSSSSNKEGLNGELTFFYYFSGYHVTDANLRLTGILKTTYPNSETPNKAQTTNFGFSVASPGSDEYSLTYNGWHKATSTVTPNPTAGSQVADPKIFSISLDEYPLNLNQPADLQESLNLNFNVANNEIAYYDYDFSRDLEIDDVSSNSAMELTHRES